MRFIAPYLLTTSTLNLALHFHPDHLVDLRASGLNDETVRTAGVYSIRPCDIAHFFLARKGVPSEIQSALCFPYQGGDFARIKLFPSPGKMKYAQPPGTSARLYMPFPVDDGPLWIGEGEKKTLAAWQHGLNAVGIGGVWSWLSNGQPIDDLNLIHWDGREVTIVPDSDVFRRPNLLRAIYALSREIQGYGANVYVAQIPQPTSAKVGLYDFLVAGSKVSDLDVFVLSHRIFKKLAFWHSRWKFKKEAEAA